jgi:hypothetical protein
MAESTLTPSKLWKRMTPEQRLQTAQVLWAEEQATEDQVQAILLIAQQKKFRPKSVVALDDERKAKHFAGLLTLPDPMAARALVLYHLSRQREMMGAFLDALGIEHEDGLIKDEAVKPDQEKLSAAVQTIAGKFPAEHVSLYLDTLVCQDPDTWGALAELQGELRADS